MKAVAMSAIFGFHQQRESHNNEQKHSQRANKHVVLCAGKVALTVRGFVRVTVFPRLCVCFASWLTPSMRRGA